MSYWPCVVEHRHDLQQGAGPPYWLLPPDEPDEEPLAGPDAPLDEPEDVPPADELPGPPVSEDAAGGQSLLLADVLSLELPLLAEADGLPGGQFAAALLPEAPVLGEVLSEELVLGVLVLVSEELVLGELEYEPLDCAIAPAESASRALAVAAASNLSFIVETPFRNASVKCAVGWRAIAMSRDVPVEQALFRRLAGS